MKNIERSINRGRDILAENEKNLRDFNALLSTRPGIHTMARVTEGAITASALEIGSGRLPVIGPASWLIGFGAADIQQTILDRISERQSGK